MPATLIFKDRVVYGETEFAEFVIWRVPEPVPPSKHSMKYRLAYISAGKRVVGFDNERGKGDHQHVDGTETAYRFETVEQLVKDFKNAVRDWRKRHGED